MRHRSQLVVYCHLRLAHAVFKAPRAVLHRAAPVFRQRRLFSAPPARDRQRHIGAVFYPVNIKRKTPWGLGGIAKFWRGIKYRRALNTPEGEYLSICGAIDSECYAQLDLSDFKAVSHYFFGGLFIPLAELSLKAGIAEISIEGRMLQVEDVEAEFLQEKETALNDVNVQRKEMRHAIMRKTIEDVHDTVMMARVMIPAGFCPRHYGTVLKERVFWGFGQCGRGASPNHAG